MAKRALHVPIGSMDRWYVGELRTCTCQPSVFHMNHVPYQMLRNKNKNFLLMKLEKLGVGHCHDVLTARGAHAYAKDNPREVRHVSKTAL